MKPKLFDRFLLLLLLLCIIALGVSCFLVSVGVFSVDAAYAIITPYVALGVWFSIVVGAAGLLLVVIALRLIVGVVFLSNRADEPGVAKAAPPATSAVVCKGDFGTATISLAAIDAMVQRHCRANGKLRETTSVVTMRDDGIAIDLRVLLLSDANVPATISELQKSLKAYIEGLTGIPVNDISALVVSAPTQAK